MFSPLYFLIPIGLLFFSSCVTEVQKFPGSVKQQWVETSMIDDTLLEVSGQLQVVASMPQSLGYERLCIYQKASHQVRSVIDAEGTPDFIRETNQFLRFPILEMFYLHQNKMYRFAGQKGLSVYGDPPPAPQPIPNSAQGEIKRMRALKSLQQSLQ
ncbi:hypothetical protein SAMN02745166_02539 [Prosthecobacter debontii]|uniref:Uncharacterized protein n=1 Tax=Prosthecobacter debontii TaxID=48467 RepID=A0A1T4Y605_9BACT|nr:hypothetical protein [Prosthecobacter debontii]SKA97083.1 hypothetical protein SAMN02745166_02539 [Prosthecobacter debontii]